jgi:hypothetical protein
MRPLHDVDFRYGKAKIVEKVKFTRSLPLRGPAFETIFLRSHSGKDTSCKVLIITKFILIEYQGICLKHQ